MLIWIRALAPTCGPILAEFGGSHADIESAPHQTRRCDPRHQKAKMNLILSFVHFNKPTKAVGPFHAVRLDATGLRDAANDELIAVHHEHQWEVQGVRYYRLDSTSRVRIRFEKSPQGSPQSRHFGPYARFSAVDGIAYVDDRVFAYVDAPSSDWFCYEDGHHWRAMVVTDAATRQGAKLLLLVAALVPLLHGVIVVSCGAWEPLYRRLGEMRRVEGIYARMQCLFGGLVRLLRRMPSLLCKCARIFGGSAPLLELYERLPHHCGAGSRA